MKFSKSGILTLSGMLIANSFLLMATTYAKNIDTNPANAQQEIKSVHFIEGEKEKVCSLVLFDISGSMGSGGSSGKINGCYVEGDKRNNAINGAINYSRNFLNGTPENEIGLILFGNNAYYGEGTKGTYKNCGDKNYNYGQQLSNNPLEKSNFGHPGENTYLYKGLDKAYEVFQDRPDCTKKIAVIITDGVPSESSTTTKNSISKLKSAEVTIYSVGYGLKEGNGSKNGETILSNFFEGFFYNADAGNIDDVFEKTIGGKNDNISVENNKLKINSDNFILTKIGEDIINQIEWNSLYSNILGGESHLIASSESSTIIAGQSNSIQLSLYSTILGGQSNKIVDRILADNNENNAILGGYKNNLKKGRHSVIIGGSGNTTNGEYTAIAGNNSTVVGKNSVALGNKTKISANNSFYWTDTSHAGVLKKDNVFAVVSNKGMAVNTNNPNANAQLTINGSLVVIDSENDTQIQCGDGNGNGILKVVKKNENEKCFCSCDGSSRKSLYNGSCEYLCNTNMKPVCGTTVTLECKDGYKMYSGSCNSGVAINTSYYVTSNNKVHWACQTYDGKTVNCSGTLSTNNAGNCNGGGVTPNEPVQEDICAENKTLNGPCQLKFQIEVDGNPIGYWEQFNYVNNLDSMVLNANVIYNCNEGNGITCEGNKMNICSDCENEPNGSRKNSSVNNILGVILGGHGNVPTMGISIKDGYEYVGWYRNGCPLNIGIKGINEEHLTCNSTFTLKLKSK